MKKLLFAFILGLSLITAGSLLTSCTKEGPQGPAGQDANETCKQCHSATVVDAVAVEFELSKHSWGEAAFEEAGNASCGVCHEQKAFVYVCKNNIPSTFTLNTTTGKWTNDYSSVISDAIGEISCFTCHSSLHTTYGYSDLTSLTTVAPVSMTMWAGAKEINLTQDDSKSNLCVKCHQPRPMVCNAPSSTKTNGRLLSYDTLINFPSMVMFDSASPSSNKWIKPSYRMHVHYGSVGAIFAGKGGIEYPGSIAYGNSAHTNAVSCQECHMATPMTGIAGGHAFNVRNAKESALAMTGNSPTTFNFNGCNVSGCHADNPMSLANAQFSNTRTEIKGLLDDLAAKINELGGGHDILHAETDGATNLWAGETTGNYDGYLDIYGAGTNDNGYWKDPYLAAGNATNDAKPMFPTLKMVHVGAIINFQMCLREFSLGVHNHDYVYALLTNTLEALNNDK